MSSKECPQGDQPGWARFFVLWTVSGANYFAYATLKLALVLFAAHLTRSPLLVSGVVFVQLLPTFVFGLPAGVLVDRYDRRIILILTTVLRIVVFALVVLATLIGPISLLLLYALALLLGVTETIDEPALAAAVPMVVAQTRLERANAFLVGAQNVIGLLADPLGAFIASVSVILTMSMGGLFAAIALMALLSLSGTLRSDRADRDKGQAGEMAGYHIGTDILEGLHYLWNQKLLLAIGLMAGVINACWEGYLVVMVLYAVKPGPLGLTSPAYGVLLMSISIGSIIGALLTIPVQNWLGRRWAIGFNILGNGLMFMVPALTQNLWLIGGAMLLGSVSGPMWTITAAALQARIVPPELQGRVNASYRILSIGASVLGPVLGGVFAQSFGLPITLAIFGVLTWLLFVPFFLVITERAMLCKQL
jgi:MFS family permease